MGRLFRPCVAQPRYWCRWKDILGREEEVYCDWLWDFLRVLGLFLKWSYYTISNLSHGYSTEFFTCCYCCCCYCCVDIHTVRNISWLPHLEIGHIHRFLVTPTPTFRMALEERVSRHKSKVKDFQATTSAVVNDIIHDPDIVRRLGLARKERGFEEYLDRDKGIIKSMHSITDSWMVWHFQLPSSPDLHAVPLFWTPSYEI